MWTFLERVDPDAHISRWYAVSIQPTLFGRVAVVRLWGSRVNDFQQRLAQPYDDEASARAAADRLIRAKVRRGYRITSGYKPPGLDKGQPTPRHRPPGTRVSRLAG
jgi:predicted DNA-binding WGR domain protein